MERFQNAERSGGDTSFRGFWRTAAAIAKGLGQAIFTTYSLGARAMLLAPAIALFAILPEMAQHVAEISLGMFNSTDAFRAHAVDPLRMGFGYVKIAGVALSILATARFFAFGAVRAALLVRPAVLARILLGIAMLIVAALPFEWMRSQGLPTAVDVALMLTSSVLQAPLMVYVLAILIEDRSMTLRLAFTEYWPTAILMMLLLGAAFLPAQVLHMMNHHWAIGSPDAAVWALMLFDSLVVGFLAVLIGAGLFVGYRTGASWRGWTIRPESLRR